MNLKFSSGKNKIMGEVVYKTVWLIDDDSLSNFVNEAILNSQQFARKIVVFNNVQEALYSLDLAVNGKVDFPDVIFLDMYMPGLDGWDFLAGFRDLPAEIKLKCSMCMLSSSIDETNALKAKQEEDITDFIVKPLTTEGLESIKFSGGS